MAVTTVNGLNKYSRVFTETRSQVGSQAMLYGIGLTDEDMKKPQVGIASMGWEGNTCKMHLNDLAQEVKKGANAAGLVVGQSYRADNTAHGFVFRLIRNLVEPGAVRA